MKTHILRLEPHDDIISVRDKMGWAHAARILLVWPESTPVLSRRLDLVLLQRQSASLGAQLALVTRDPEVRAHATELGIPTFRKLRQAQSGAWRAPRRYRQLPARLQIERLKSGAAPYPPTPAARAPAPSPAPAEAAAESSPAVLEPAPEAQSPVGKPPVDQPPLQESSALPVSAPAAPTVDLPLVRRSDGIPLGLRRPAPRLLSPLARLLFFTLGVLALLSIAVVLTPSATLTLAPETRWQEFEIPVSTGPDVTEIELSGVIPSYPVSISVEGRSQEPASATVLTPQGRAAGRVTFTNLTSQRVTIPVGLVVRTLGPDVARFSVTRGGTVPAGPGQSLELPVEALSLGSQGNQAPGKLVAIEGELGTLLTAENQRPTTGGSQRKDRAPQPADRRRLAERLQLELYQQALQELGASLAEGDVLLPGTLALKKTLEETYLPAEDQPADQVSLYLRLEYSARAASGRDLQRLAAEILDANLPPGYVPDPGSLTIRHLDTPRLSAAGQTQWTLLIRRRLLAQVQPGQAVQLALGLSPEQAGQRLAGSLPLQSAPQIQMSPAWWPRLPVLPFRIQVISSAGEP